MDPGIRLDFEIAAAIGAKYRESWMADDGCRKMAGWYYGEIPAFQTLPRFSEDLNAAFMAAEKVGLFSETFWRTLGRDELGESWCVFEQDGVYKTSLTHDQPTPALAICAAILKLKA